MILFKLCPLSRPRLKTDGFIIAILATTFTANPTFIARICSSSLRCDPNTKCIEKFELRRIRGSRFFSVALSRRKLRLTKHRAAFCVRVAIFRFHHVHSSTRLPRLSAASGCVSSSRGSKTTELLVRGTRLIQYQVPERERPGPLRD